MFFSFSSHAHGVIQSEQILFNLAQGHLSKTFDINSPLTVVRGELKA
jgi:hypothetical protein